MLEDAAKGADRSESGSKTAAVVASLVAPTRLDKASQPAPARARRVGDHRMRSRVEPSIALLVPGVDSRQAVVHATGLHVERRDRPHPIARFHGAPAASRA